MAANPQTNQPGTFNESGTNTATFSGLRTVARNDHDCDRSADGRHV
jgi:hypothetical protein